MRERVRCYSYDELNESLLKDFSEGNQALEDLLKSCYKNKIMTRACCIGHKEDGPQSQPYISFEISDNLFCLMEKTISTLLGQGNFSKYVNIEIIRENNSFIVTFRFNCFEEELRDLFFSLIQKEITSVIKNSMNEPSKYDDLFNIFMDQDDKVCLKITNNGMVVCKLVPVYMALDGDGFIEVPKEESLFSVLSAKPIYSIASDEILTFITNTKNNKKNKSF